MHVRDMYALRDSSKWLYFTYCQFNVVDFKTGSAAQSSVSTSYFHYRHNSIPCRFRFKPYVCCIMC